jgi:hypothetical protein
MSIVSDLLRPALLGAFVLGAVPAFSQSVGGVGGSGGLTYQRAAQKFPGLSRVTFEKADLNGDGVIESNEMPVLQSIYQATRNSR